MNIYVARHGQTDLNRQGCWQGRIDMELNDTGRAQAEEMGEKLKGIRFDKVYASTLSRAVETAEIMTGLSESEIIKDERIIEADFGKYDAKPFNTSLRMSLYWALPEVFPAPPTVESIKEMKNRVQDFLKTIDKQNAENVLLVCHGGIMRVISGFLMDRRSGYLWRPRPENCEVRVFSSDGGRHRLTGRI